MEYEVEINVLKARIEALEKIVYGTNFSKENNINNINNANTLKNVSRDKTKYMFNGKVYPKNRLVLAVIESYCEKFNPTFEELQLKFDKSLQGSLNVVEKLEIAEKISDFAKRYFAQNPIQLKNGTAVVCTQWGIFNITRFIKQAQNLGFDISEI